MSFTLYTGVYGFFNMLGHLLKAISFFLIYKVLSERTLRNPCEMLYLDLMEANKNLKKLSIIDQLTGV